MKSQKGYAIAFAHPLHLAPGAYLGALWLRFKRWNQLAKERRQLASLNDAMLKDLGLNRGDVMQESERPFWDDPLAK
jgi:uncharacterized protein YjiS (DUF1127 family)